MVELSKRLHKLRRARALTLREVAAGTGLTIGFLSQLERGQTNVSVVNLKRIADYYGVSIRELFDDGTARAYVTRATGRRSLVPTGNGLVIESLTPPGSSRLGAVLVRADAGAEDVSPYPHEADELTIVLSGTVRYWLGQEDHLLGPHDSIFHPPGVPHRWQNAGPDEKAVVLTISAPATL